MRIGFLYAGQGSQHTGLGADLYERYPVFKKIIDGAAVPVLKGYGFDIRQVMFEDGSGLINQTSYTQPCMCAFAAGVTAILKEMGIEPVIAAGLSLGEYSALCAAGVFDPVTAVELTAFRGRAMEDASEGIDTAMAAVLGLEPETIARIASGVSDRGKGIVSVTNINCPGQTVIGGEKNAVSEASEELKAAGARRILPLNVSGPFHTAYMEAAGEKLAGKFREISFNTPTVPVVFNATGDICVDKADIPGLLIRQVQSTVRMQDCIRKMSDYGIDMAVEIGPGKVLSGFVKKTVRGLSAVSVETAEDIEKLAFLSAHLPTA